MLCIVSYDILDSKRRTKIANTLLDFGNRVQYSVFECLLDDKLLEKMTKKIEGIISEEDSVRIYTLCAQCERLLKIMGKGKITKDEDVYIF